MAETSRRVDLQEWMNFCKEKIEPIDKIWNKRLEDTDREEDDEENSDDGVISIDRRIS